MTIISLLLSSVLLMAGTALPEEIPTPAALGSETAADSGSDTYALTISKGDRFTLTVMRKTASSMMNQVSHESYGMRFDMTCVKIGEDGSIHLEAVIKRLYLHNESRSGKQYFDSDAEKNDTPVLEAVAKALLGRKFNVQLTRSGCFEKVTGLDSLSKEFLSNLEEKPMVKSIASSMVKGFLSEGVLGEIWSIYFFPRPDAAEPAGTPHKKSFDLPVIGTLDYTMTSTGDGTAEYEGVECPKVSLLFNSAAVQAKKTKLRNRDIILSQKPAVFKGTAFLDPQSGLPRSIEFESKVSQILEIQGQERFQKVFQTVTWKSGSAGNEEGGKK